MTASAALLVAFALSAAPFTRIAATADLSGRAGGRSDERGEFTPGISLSGRYGGSLLVNSSYAPRLTLGAVNGFDVLHLGTASLQWAPSASSSLSAAETFSLGWTDFSYRFSETDSLAQLSRALEPVPGALRAVTSGTDLNYWSELSGRTSMDLGVGYFASGGLDATARAELPLQRGPYGSVSLTHRLTELDSVAARVDASSSSFSSGSTRRLARGTGEWTRQLSDVSEVVLRAGGAISLRDGQSAALLPVLGGELRTKLEVSRRILESGVSLSLTPWTNPLTSVVSNRARALGFVRSDPERKLHLMLAAGAARSVALAEDRAFFAGAQAGWRVQPELLLHAEVIAQQQWMRTDGAADRLWNAGVGISFEPGPRAGAIF